MEQHNSRRRIGAEPVQAPGGPSHAVADGYKVAIRRIGCAVEITLTSSDEYAGIELYDMLMQSLQNGSLRLEVKFAPT